MPIKIATILGARPQFIKASVVSTALRACVGVNETIIHTGQHIDPNMSDVFFEELGIPVPSHHLGIHGGGHGSMTGRMLIGLEEVFEREKPDIVMVYGDTNSTLAGALVASKLHIPIAHVESGLRSFNRSMPEEINRILVDRISDWLFTPTEVASANLKEEGADPNKIYRVGDVMYDAALLHGNKVTQEGRILAAQGLKEKGYVLATVHRAHNTDDPERLAEIIVAFTEVGFTIPVLWPIHPRTKKAMERFGLLAGIGHGVKLIDPIGYLDMVQVEKYASLIVTDSGGVQKEAFFHGVPCVTLRAETEWTELVEAGWNRLAPVEEGKLVETILTSLESKGRACVPYGDGRASVLIAEVICRS